MARAENGKDYYVEEAALANIDSDGTPATVMPMRWFMRDRVLWAVVHRLRYTSAHDAYVIDGTRAGCLELPLTAFFLNSEDLDDPDCQQRYNLPPLKMTGIRFSVPILLRNLILCSGISRDATSDVLSPWSQPPINPWRVKAKGERVHSVPLWTYCDDTSGNVSKKWNKHNSVLFTLGGLPREYSQMLYNVHFMATSNTASPLEMMETVTAMLRYIFDVAL